MTSAPPSLAQLRTAAEKARQYERQGAYEAMREELSHVDPKIVVLLLDALDQRDAALRASIVALADWTRTYASELCHDADVQESLARISDSGGTLAYIACLQQANRAALADPPAGEGSHDWDDGRSSDEVGRDGY